MAFVSSTVLTGIAAASTAIGTGISVYSGLQQAATAERVAEYNAKVMENEANRVNLETRENVRRQRVENQRLLARQRAQYAKAGVIMEGTPLTVMAETAGLLEMEALDTARAGRAQESRLIQRAGQERISGKAASQGYVLGAGTSLLSGAAKTANILR